MGGSDFNKGRQNFVVPFPEELRPIFRACIGDRTGGPLLRQRKAFVGLWKRSILSAEHLAELFDQRLVTYGRGTAPNEQDRKREFRRLLCDYGGVSPGQLAREFKRLCQTVGFDKSLTIYVLRHAVTTAMKRSGMSDLDLTYMTGHTVRDIVAEYVGLRPAEAMAPYFERSRGLLEAITQRAGTLGLGREKYADRPRAAGGVLPLRIQEEATRDSRRAG
jgi:integrase